VSLAGPNGEDPYGGDTEKAAADLRTAYATGDPNIIQRALTAVAKALGISESTLKSLFSGITGNLTGGQLITGAALMAAIALDARTKREETTTTAPASYVTKAAQDLMGFGTALAPALTTISPNEAAAGNLASSAVGTTQPLIDKASALMQAGALPVDSKTYQPYIDAASTFAQAGALPVDSKTYQPYIDAASTFAQAGALPVDPRTYQPYIDSASQLALSGSAPITKDQIQSNMNPYLDLVAGRVTEAGEVQRNAATRRAAMAGADLPGTTPGMGNQADIASGIVGRNTLDALGLVYAGGYDKALSAAQNTSARQLDASRIAAGLGTTELGAGQNTAGRQLDTSRILSGLGTTELGAGQNTAARQLDTSRVLAGLGTTEIGAGQNDATRALSAGSNLGALATTQQGLTDAQIGNLTATGALPRTAATAGLGALGTALRAADAAAPSTVTHTLPPPSTVAQLVAAAGAAGAFGTGNKVQVDALGNLI
jgi:hypothetical protein